MAHAYTVRLADGKEYGPADLEALLAWKAEGRIGPETLVWREGATDWRPLAEVLESGEIRAEGILDETVTVAARPSPAPAAAVGPSLADPPAPAAPAEVRLAAPARPRPGPSRTARRPRPSPLRIVIPLAILAALVAGVALWWRAGQPARDQKRAEAGIRGYALPDRSYSDDLLGLRLDLPEGWIVLRPDSPFFHAPAAKLRLAHPRFRAFARLQAQARPRGSQALDESLDRALEDWRLFTPGLQEQGRSDGSVGKTPARKANVSWDADGQQNRGMVVVWHDGWNEFALLAWGPASAEAEVNTATSSLVSQLQMAGVAAARIRSAADAVASAIPELSRASVEALVERRLAAGEPTDDLPQTSLRVVSRGLRALTGQESEEMGQIYAQVYKPLKEKERARLAAWLAQVRAGALSAPDEAQAMRQAFSDGLLTLPEDLRVRLQALNEKAVTAALAQP